MRPGGAFRTCGIRDAIVDYLAVRDELLSDADVRRTFAPPFTAE